MSSHESADSLSSRSSPIPLVSSIEVCELLRCTLRTLYKYRKDGWVTAVRGPTGAMEFDIREVEKLVGIVGRHRRNKQKLIDSRKNTATLYDTLNTP